MILTALLQWILNVISWLLSHVIDVSDTGFFANATTYAVGLIAAINNIVPLTALVVVLAFDVALEAGILGWKIFNWVLRRFPTQS